MSSLGERLKGANRGGIRHRLTPRHSFRYSLTLPLQGSQVPVPYPDDVGRDARTPRHEAHNLPLCVFAAPSFQYRIYYEPKLAAALLPETCGPWNRLAWHGNRFDRRAGINGVACPSDNDDHTPRTA